MRRMIFYGMCNYVGPTFQCPEVLAIIIASVLFKERVRADIFNRDLSGCKISDPSHLILQTMGDMFM